MQPYQEASQEIQRQGEFPKRALQTAGSLASGLIGGGAILGRVLPLLSKHIPQNLAIKGLSKIDPRFGTFINKAISAGKSFDEVREFIKDKAQGEDESKNIIEKYSPELHQFMKEQVSQGRPVLEAGAVAQNDKRFKPAIEKLSKDHKTNWSNIIQGIYGSGEQAQPSQARQQPQQPQQQGSGQGQQALMAILQELKKSRGG